MKLNSADFSEDGMTADESALLCKRLDEHLDLIELSGGSYETMGDAMGHSHNKKASTVKREAFFIEVGTESLLDSFSQTDESNYS